MTLYWSVSVPWVLGVLCGWTWASRRWLWASIRYGWAIGVCRANGHAVCPCGNPPTHCERCHWIVRTDVTWGAPDNIAEFWDSRR